MRNNCYPLKETALFYLKRYDCSGHNRLSSFICVALSVLAIHASGYLAVNMQKVEINLQVGNLQLNT